MHLYYLLKFYKFYLYAVLDLLYSKYAVGEIFESILIRELSLFIKFRNIFTGLNYKLGFLKILS